MKDWIREFVEGVLAWVAFVREMASRLGQLASSIEFLERDLDQLIKVASAMRVAHAEMN